MNAEELRVARWIFWDALTLLPEGRAAAFARLFFTMAAMWAETALQEERHTPAAGS
jgi:hypothetical protein